MQLSLACLSDRHNQCPVADATVTVTLEIDDRDSGWWKTV
jgi:hypothetical protein